MTPEAHAAFTASLLTTLSAAPDVLGLVLLGSSSGLPPSPDAFSDHDFFVVTARGAQDHYRTTRAWLPDADAIALALRETAHGVKVLYAGGHVAEFAVFDLDEISLARVNRYRVALDRGEVAARMARVHEVSATAAAAAPDLGWHMGELLTQLVVGVYRDARGERLSGHRFVRVLALEHLLALLQARLPRDIAARLDDLDVTRRFELVLPELGQELEAALRAPVPIAARRLLEIAVRELADLVPPGAQAAVERALASTMTSTR